MYKFYIETLGCNKNQVDSEKMAGVLINHGLNITDDSADADIVIINTCAFINDAKEEAIETIFQAVTNKTENQKIFVTGCFAQRYHGSILDEIPEVDGVMGVGDISLIIDLVEQKSNILLPDYSEDKIYDRVISNYPGWVYIKISDGCSNNCSYCTIPLIRGPLRSRSIESIIEEVLRLKTLHIKEYILISQDTANYGFDVFGRIKLPELINRISENIDEDAKIRVLYMHPDHIDKTLLDELKNNNKFIPYFDIPFQSGSDRILKKMGRRNSSSDNLALVRQIRQKFPENTIRSTFICGFPGEDEQDHLATLNFIKSADIDWLGGFKYSKEENTVAYNYKPFVSERIKQRRLDQIIKLSEEMTTVRLQRFLGTIQKVLIEERVAEDNLYIGRIWTQAPEVDGLTVVEGDNLPIGGIITAEIRNVNGNDYFAVAL